MKAFRPFSKEKTAYRSIHSMRQSFMRDYLLASIPAILLLLLIMSAGALFAMTYLADLLQRSNSELNNSAETHLKRLGEQIIQTKARDVARQVEIYLIAHPNAMLADLQTDPYFTEIAVQKVGQTGYTTLYEAGTGITRIHPNATLINKEMSFLAEKLPGFWAVFEPSLSGKESAGYYDWLEADKSIRLKYMVMTPVNTKLQNVTLMIAATTYIDEFSAPVVAMREQTESISRQYQGVVRQQSLILLGSGLGIIAITLFIVYGLGQRATLRYIQPVEQLAGAVTELGTGNWQVASLGETSARQDEIGALARAFQSMGTQLRDLFNNQEQLVKERTRQLQLEKQFLESLIVNSPVAIVVTNLDNAITTWNPAAEKLFGYTQAEAADRNIDEIVTSEDMRAEAVGYSKKITEGDLIQAITQRSRKEGTLVDVELLSVPVLVAGEHVGAVAMYHDITELQHARLAAEAANRSKSDFLATMSHEIRTPMNGIIGMTSLLLDTELTSEQHEYAATVRSSADSLLGIINDILDFSKIEAGKLDLEEQLFDIYECVESAFGLVASRAAEKKLELAYIIDPLVPHAIIGDVTRLRQILLNFLGNSIKFTEKGEVVVAAEIYADAESAGKQAAAYAPGQRITLHFSVRDTGVGIPPDRIDRLFKSFSQVDTSTTRKYGGTGLGLAISKRLSELMGGKVWVESDGAPGKGSVFHFTLQVEVGQAQPKAYLNVSPEQLQNKRILIVDDNATNRRILTTQTRAWGMIPRETEFPLQALKWIQKGEPFDIALLDLQMPEMDGITLAQEIRRILDAKQLPLIMLTSMGRKDADADAVQFAAYLHKPIHLSQLHDTLMEIAAQGSGQVVHKVDAPRTAQIDSQTAENLPLRILLAEDHPVNQRLALQILRKMGYNADLAANGLEVLQALERQPYDVVLMDVQMPEMDGLEASRKICQKWTREDRPRIIAMTAEAMSGDREKCLAAGMDDYLSKPIRIAELTEALSKCHSRRGE